MSTAFKPAGGSDPWTSFDTFGFRLARPSDPTVRLQYGDEIATVEFDPDWSQDRSPSVTRITERNGWQIVHQDGETMGFRLAREEGAAAGSASDGAILAPMPGKVIAIDVGAGEAVAKGQRLLVLEAMKMEHALTAPFDGTVAELAVAEGQQVQVEALLARVEKVDT
jgi:3-methylcrotonyl-CoA carboxylase alpha subunit